ncbi:hypothetical protein [Listeria monocytogenes]|uniref:hypothetical protein n=1 Tax=Listeria monocytogenes TaxID=1639 RepID=UPI0002593D48|nr:hypothetical protein [Listeria monocytogenes]AFH78679.1 hypothetical protein MUO_00565 [Listeria monocytogenes 07PF0776]
MAWGDLNNKVKIKKYDSAESVNKYWDQQNNDQPPYTPKTPVQDLELLVETKLVRE